jgi:outer membrane murein-binding lipoprotein Lpp
MKKRIALALAAVLVSTALLTGCAKEKKEVKLQLGRIYRREHFRRF